jgi:glutathione S-transferase
VLNPTGRTPVLVDDEFKLWESNAIMQYLASRAPNSLWPNMSGYAPTSRAGELGF